MLSIKDDFKEFEKEINNLSLDELDAVRQRLSENASDERIIIVEKKIDELIDEMFKAEELNKRLEQKFKRQKKLKTFVAKIICILLLIVAFFSYLKGYKPYESFRAFCIGSSAIVYSVISVIEKRICFLFDLYHKKAYPVKYWLSVGSLFIIGVFCVVVLGLYGPNNG